MVQESALELDCTSRPRSHVRENATVARYIVRPKAAEVFDADHGASHTASEVIVSDDGGFIDSGLLDADGNRLYRQRGRIRLGFRED